MKVVRRLIRDDAGAGLPGAHPTGRRPPTPASASAGRCSGATTSRSRPRRRRWRRWLGRSRTRRSARTCSAASRTCWSASSSHPAMLLYLDQAQSVGPDTMAATFLSRSGKHGRPQREPRPRDHGAAHRGRGGRLQPGRRHRVRPGDDRLEHRRPAGPGSRRQVHVPPRAPTSRARAPSWAGRYAQDGMAQALAVMKDLAASPHTAHHIAAEARPPLRRRRAAAGAGRSAAAQLPGHGRRLGEVAKTLVLAPEAWSPQAVKFKTPYEFLVSAWRAAGVSPDGCRRSAGPERAGPEALQRALAQGLAGGGRGLVRAGRGDQAHGLGEAPRRAGR